MTRIASPLPGRCVALAASALVDEHRLVGPADQLGRSHARPPFRHADAGTDLDRRQGRVERVDDLDPFNRHGERLRFLVRVGQPGMGQGNRKLVAAQTCDNVGFAGLGRQKTGDVDQHIISGQVTKPVIDQLEVVEIDVKQAELAAMPVDHGDGARKLPVECPAVEQRCRGVVIGLQLGNAQLFLQGRDFAAQGCHFSGESQQRRSIRRMPRRPVRHADSAKNPVDDVVGHLDELRSLRGDLVHHRVQLCCGRWFARHGQGEQVPASRHSLEFKHRPG